MRIGRGALRGALLAGVLAWSRLAANDGAGTTSAAFFKLGSGARAISLGESYVAVADDPEAITYNPAGLALVRLPSLEFTHDIWFADAHSEHLIGTLTLGPSSPTYALAVHYLGIPSQDVTEATGSNSFPLDNFRVTGSFSPYDFYMSMACGASLWQGTQVGGTLKILGESVDGSTGVALAVDAGAMTTAFVKGLRFGLAVQNAGLPSHMLSDSFPLPLVIRAGASYLAADGNLLLAAETDFPNDNQPAWSLGAEYSLLNAVYPRLGIRADGIFNPWSLGLGFKMGPANLDLAVQSAAELGMTYRGTLTYYFQPAAGPASEAPSEGLVLPGSAVPITPANQAPPSPLVPGLTAVTNNPQPFKSGGTYIFFNLKNPAQIVIQVSQGAAVLRILNAGILPAGSNRVFFDGSDAAGTPLAPGHYVYAIQATTRAAVETRTLGFDKVSDRPSDEAN